MGESILKEILILDFAEEYKHLSSQEYVPFTKDTLFTTKQQMVDTGHNTRGQSDCIQWFQGRWCMNQSFKESIFPRSLLTKMLSPSSNVSKTPEPCLWGKCN